MKYYIHYLNLYRVESDGNVYAKYFGNNNNCWWRQLFKEVDIIDLGYKQISEEEAFLLLL